MHYSRDRSVENVVTEDGTKNAPLYVGMVVLYVDNLEWITFGFDLDWLNSIFN